MWTTVVNQHTVAEFYDNFDEVKDQHCFKPEDIHNTDEMAVIVPMYKSQRISVTFMQPIYATGNVLPQRSLTRVDRVHKMCT